MLHFKVFKTMLKKKIKLYKIIHSDFLYLGFFYFSKLLDF